MLSDEKIYNKAKVEAIPIIEVLNWLSLTLEKNNLNDNG